MMRTRSTAPFRFLPAAVGLLAAVAIVGALLPPEWSPLVGVAGRVFTLSLIVLGWLGWAWISQRRGGMSIHDRLALLRGAALLVAMASRHRLHPPPPLTEQQRGRLRAVIDDRPPPPVI
jgi:hypothetical protein